MSNDKVSAAVIPLTQGQYAIVDQCDLEWLSQWKWIAKWNESTSSFYAARTASESGKRIQIYMARLILGCIGKEQEGEHRNHNSLDNRRQNLRVASRTQNMHNTKVRKDSVSGIKGISPWYGKWRARIRINGKQKCIGYFDTQEQAAEAYRVAAIELHGEFANV